MLYNCWYNLIGGDNFTFGKKFVIRIELLYWFLVIRIKLRYWFLPLSALPQRNGAFYIDCVRQKLWPTSKRSFLLLQEPYISAYILLQNNHATYKSKLGILGKYVKKWFKQKHFMDLGQKDDIWSWSQPHARIVVGKNSNWLASSLMVWFVYRCACQLRIGCAKKKLGQNDNKQPQSWVGFVKVCAGK